ncbi:MAG: hypothetical protein GF364_11405 [Candidatus Lokiarchaeota archaeon]|nr:hypothetical protein [Candidatus Lokiarchaeota archaeon]
MEKTAHDPSEKDKETLLSFRYLLGEMGIQMLVAIYRGANTKTAIQLLSGVPMSCVIGRLPVLLNLNLVYQTQEEYHVTEKGIQFLKVTDQD